MNGLDDDKDGFVDYPADPGCATPADSSELNLAEILANLRKLLSNPAVTQTNQLVMPALVVANTLASLSLLNFLSYARYLFTQPFAIVSRRKRKKWGVVYDSLTKQPIDLAIVRLYDKATSRVVQSRVTDRLGRYSFLAAPGRYYITVTKPQFIFPTTFLKDDKEDISYLDLYHGETIAVTEANASVTANIPIDSQTKERPARQIIIQYYLRKLQYAIAFSGIPLSIVSAIITPTPLSFALFGFHCLLYVLFRRLSYQKPPKNWGIVYEQGTRKPIAHAIARIYDKKYNKLLETRVSDARGRYAFLVNKNVYVVTAEKLGYQPFKTADIDLVTKKADEIVGIDIALNKARAVSGVATPVGTLAEPKSLAPADVTASLNQAKVMPSPNFQPSFTQPGVGRASLEELTQQKTQLDKVKADIDAKQVELQQLEDKVDTIEHQVEEKIAETKKPESTTPSQSRSDTSPAEPPATKPPTKSIFS